MTDALSIYLLLLVPLSLLCVCVLLWLTSPWPLLGSPKSTCGDGRTQPVCEEGETMICFVQTGCVPLDTETIATSLSVSLYLLISTTPFSRMPAPQFGNSVDKNG